jgi:hypothetical protein
MSALILGEGNSFMKNVAGDESNGKRTGLKTGRYNRRAAA